MIKTTPFEMVFIIRDDMKNIPVFTTEYGIASLVLKEVPYKRVAFVHIRDVQPGQLHEHLKECIDFCRVAGAERVLAAGNEGLEAYPLHSIAYKMCLSCIPRESLAMLWPVTAETVGSWREIYNNAMGDYDNHATLTKMDEKNIIQSGGAYFVHRDGKLLGIGWVEGGELLALVSVIPGMGETVARTLLAVSEAEQITLEVVSTNERAIRLYERMGFVKTAELRRWYRVL